MSSVAERTRRFTRAIVAYSCVSCILALNTQARTGRGSPRFAGRNFAKSEIKNEGRARRHVGVLKILEFAHAGNAHTKRKRLPTSM